MLRPASPSGPGELAKALFIIRGCYGGFPKPEAQGLMFFKVFGPKDLILYRAFGLS